MKLIRLAMVPLALTFALGGCEDEPEDFAGAGGTGGVGGMGGRGGAGGMGGMDRDPSPAETSAMGTVMADQTGRTMSAITVSTMGAMRGSSTSVTIPAGSQLLDEMGNPVTGMVEISVDNYNIDPAEGGMAFQMDTGVTIPGGTVGSGAINISADTTLVVEVPGGVDITMNVPPTAVLPNGQVIMAGSPVALNEYDPETSSFAQFQTIQLPPLTPATGSHAVTFQRTTFKYALGHEMASGSKRINPAHMPKGCSSAEIAALPSNERQERRELCRHLFVMWGEIFTGSPGGG